MSRWRKRFDDLKIKEKIQEVIGLLELVKFEEQSEEWMFEYSRLLKVLKLMDVRFSQADPDLYSIDRWDNFSNALDSVRANIRELSTNPNMSYLQSANSYADSILNAMSPFDLSGRSHRVKAITDANDMFQKKISDELERIKDYASEVKSSLEESDKIIRQHNSRVENVEAIIEQQKTRLDQVIDGFQKQFSEAQEKRIKDFSSSSKKQTEDFEKQKDNFKGVFTELVKANQTEYDVLLENLKREDDAHKEFFEQRRNEVNEIFGAIGTTAFAGNFKQTADNEAKAANLWRWIALTFMLLMIGVGGFAFYYSIKNTTDWTIFAFRMGTILILAVPAVYAANESSKHRERERLNRKYHLELSSLDAYLVLLPEEQRNRIKGTLTDKFFGVPIPKDKIAGEVTQKDFFGVLSSVLNNLTKGK